MNEVQKWEKYRNIIILSLHQLMCEHPELKKRYGEILEEQRSKAAQQDADFILHSTFPFGLDALSVDDEDDDESPDE